MSNKGIIYFGLFGDDFDPDELTEFLGLNLAEARKKGNPVPKQWSWKLSTETIDDEIIDIYEMSSELVKVLIPYSKKIVEAKEKFDLEARFQVVLWITTDKTKSTPIIGFETDVIAFLNEVQAYIDIDIYRN